MKKRKKRREQDGVLAVTLRVVLSPHPDDSEDFYARMEGKRTGCIKLCDEDADDSMMPVRMISQPHDTPEGQGVFSCGLSYISTKEVDKEMAREVFADTCPYYKDGFLLESIDASHVEVRTEHLSARWVLDRFGPLGDTDDVLCKLRVGDALVPCQLDPEGSEASRDLLLKLNGWMILTPV